MGDTREAVSQFRKSVQEVMKQTGKINRPRWLKSDVIHPRLPKELSKQAAKLLRVVCNLLRNFLVSEGKLHMKTELNTVCQGKDFQKAQWQAATRGITLKLERQTSAKGEQGHELSRLPLPERVSRKIKQMFFDIKLRSKPL